MKIAVTKLLNVRAIVVSVVVLLVAVSGVMMTLGSHAATRAIPIEAEDGSVVSPATVITDSTASEGKAIKFGGSSNSPTPPPASGVTVSLSSYGGICNGSADNTAAFNKAISDVSSKGGGVVNVPAGTCKITSNINLSGSGVTLNGASQATTIINETGSPAVMVQVTGSNLRLQNLTISDTNSVGNWMINLAGGVNGFTMQQVVLNGQYAGTNGGVHGFHLNTDTSSYKNISIVQSTIENTCYGLLVDSPFQGILNGFTVNSSNFHDNWCDDLEFNFPSGTASNVSVTNSTFSANHWSGSSFSSGIGIGFANVQTGTISDNKFDGYKLDPIHVEDRSSNITISGNTTTHSFTSTAASYNGYASHIFLVNGVHDIKVTGNTCDTSGNTNKVICVYISSGGGTAGIYKGSPYNITVSGNTFKLVPSATGIANYGTNDTIGTNSIINVSK